MAKESWQSRANLKLPAEYQLGQLLDMEASKPALDQVGMRVSDHVFFRVVEPMARTLRTAGGNLDDI